MKRSTVLSFLVAVVGFGILVPWWKGLDFLDSTVLLSSTVVSLVFVAPMVASSFKAEHVGRQILNAVGFAWLVALLILINGIVTVNLRSWLGQLLLPPTGIVISALLLNLTGAFFLGLVTAETSLRTGNPALGVRNVRIGFFLILGIFVFLSRFASPSLRSRFDEMMTTEGLLRILLLLCLGLAVLSALLWKRIQTLSRR
jgi:fluoride ion exporter CrcB/FEX